MIININSHIAFIKVGENYYNSAYLGSEEIWTRFALNYTNFLKYNYENMSLKFKNIFTYGNILAPYDQWLKPIIQTTDLTNYNINTFDKNIVYNSSNIPNKFIELLVSGILDQIMNYDFIDTSIIQGNILAQYDQWLKPVIETTDLTNYNLNTFDFNQLYNSSNIPDKFIFDLIIGILDQIMNYDFIDNSGATYGNILALYDQWLKPVIETTDLTNYNINTFDKNIVYNSSNISNKFIQLLVSGILDQIMDYNFIDTLIIQGNILAPYDQWLKPVIETTDLTNYNLNTFDFNQLYNISNIPDKFWYNELELETTTRLITTLSNTILSGQEYFLNNNFSSIKNISLNLKLTNQLISSSTGQVKIKTTLFNGDILFIEQLGVINQVMIQDNSEFNILQIHSIMTNNTSPDGIATSSYNNINAFKAFDNDISTFVELAGINASGTITYDFKNSDQHLIKQYYLKTTNQKLDSWTIEGSTDGTNFSTISTHSDDTNLQNGHVFDIQSPGIFQAYRLVGINSTNIPQIVTFSLLNPDIGSTVTISGIADKAYVINNKETLSISSDINSNILSKKLYNVTSFDNQTASISIIYDDIIVDSTQIVTEITTNLYSVLDNLSITPYINTNKP